jgi:hypothetical protein
MDKLPVSNSLGGAHIYDQNVQQANDRTTRAFEIDTCGEDHILRRPAFERSATSVNQPIGISEECIQAWSISGKVMNGFINGRSVEPNL